MFCSGVKLLLELTACLMCGTTNGNSIAGIGGHKTNIPFTLEQFFGVFGTYNDAIWPAQIIAYGLGALAVVFGTRASRNSGIVISTVLALFWVWMGVFYHILHFSTINPAARLFGIFFILQGLLLVLIGGIRNRLTFRSVRDPYSVVGWCFIAYAMLIYPLIGSASGHSYPEIPMFGVAPCPATIFTFGLLLWARSQVPIYLVLIPFLWSLIGISAALKLGVPQDYGLGVAGILGMILIVLKNRRLGKTPEQAEYA